MQNRCHSPNKPMSTMKTTSTTSRMWLPSSLKSYVESATTSSNNQLNAKCVRSPSVLTVRSNGLLRTRTIAHFAEAIVSLTKSTELPGTYLGRLDFNVFTKKKVARKCVLIMTYSNIKIPARSLFSDVNTVTILGTTTKSTVTIVYCT